MRNIFLHDEKYFSSWRKIFFFMKKIRTWHAVWIFWHVEWKKKDGLNSCKRAVLGGLNTVFFNSTPNIQHPSPIVLCVLTMVSFNTACAMWLLYRLCLWCETTCRTASLSAWFSKVSSPPAPLVDCEEMWFCYVLRGFVNHFLPSFNRTLPSTSSKFSSK